MAQQFLDYRMELAEKKLEEHELKIDNMRIGIEVLKAKVALYAALGSAGASAIAAVILHFWG